MSGLPGTRVSTINKALVRAGCLTLTAGETGHPSGPAILLLFDTVLESLAGYPWKHFMTVKKLARETTPAEEPWKYRFGLPADRTSMPFAYFDSAQCASPFMAYELRDNMAYTDAEQLWASYPRIVEPGLWPGYFTDLFTLNLAAEYALAIREDGDLRRSLLIECFGPPELHGQGGRYAYATSLDSQKEPGGQAGDGHDPLTSAYRSGA
jgi:hypothetical protein